MTFRRTALMEGDDLDGVYRGLDAGLDLRPISAAVVIGIGGSGIQTVSRLRSATRAARPDQVAIESLKYLGIDAVDLTNQNPPLPAGVTLSEGEFLNITGGSFEAATYLDGQLQHDTYLQSWWDKSYRPPMGPITEGLKRERMLGRLVFHREHDALVRRIHAAIGDAVALEQRARAEGGVGGGGERIPIYIVTSCAGGTGSSGFLEVVFACWQAARQRGSYPEIRAFVYLPSVFHAAVVRQPMGEAAAQAQRANAYAFFREVDHFCARSSELAAYFGKPVANGGMNIRDGDLLKQVYVIDNQLRGKGVVTSISDMYEAVAEALFHFTLTDVGRPLVGVDATNTDRILAEYDAFGRPRRYCGLGVNRVVFPGTTFRRHLINGYIDWFLRNGLLATTSDDKDWVRNHKVMRELETAFSRLQSDSRVVTYDDDVESFKRIVEDAAPELERTIEVSDARSMMNNVRAAQGAAVESMKESARARNRRLLDDGLRNIVTTIFTSGNGVPFAIEVLRQYIKMVGLEVTGAQGELAIQLSNLEKTQEEVEEKLDQLEEASRRTVIGRVVARGQSIIGQGQTQEEIAKELGRVIQTWVQSIIEVQEAEARLDLFTNLNLEVNSMKGELDLAQYRLQEIADNAKALWAQDALLGKDAGPQQTTTLLPGDALPEVEDCQLMVDLLGQIKEESESKLAGQAMIDFTRDWMEKHGNRGFFSLGSESEAEWAQAERSLVAELKKQAREQALKRKDLAAGGEVDRLPAGLHALHLPEENALAMALRGLADESQGVFWNWNEGRFRLGSDGEGGASSAARPSVTVSIGCPPELMDQMRELVGNSAKLIEVDDPERVVALSCEWGVPIHTLNHVAFWASDYRRLEGQRARNVPNPPPPSHIHREFADKLSPLEPTLYKEDDVAQLIGRALVFGNLLREGNPSLLAGYPEELARPRQPLLKRTESGEWVGHVVQVVDDRLVVVDQPVEMGKTWVACFEALGSHPQLQDSITEVSEWLQRAIGGSELGAAAKSYSEGALQRATEVLPPSGGERDVVNLVFDGLNRWINQMTMAQV